jgi:hypothetical protein
LDEQVMTGGSVSLITMLKVQLVLLLLASVAVQVTTVVPLGKVDPLGGAQTIVAPGQLSVTVGL